MKTNKTFKIMLMALMLMLTLGATGTTVDAAKKKTKTYKTQTVKIASGESITVKTKKKIKKVKIISKNRNFTVKKTASKKFKLSGTDKGKTQTVKVSYTNKYTQKYKIKTVAAKNTAKKIPSYAQKIVNELKPLLADPDKGLEKALADWEKRIGYECVFYLNNRTCFDVDGQFTSLSYLVSALTVDEIMKKYTASQKKALILEVYFKSRMHYSGADECKWKYCGNRNSNTYFEKLYNGTFQGVCSDGARMAYDICRYLGVKAACVMSNELDHEWCVIYVTDKNGTSYWHGIYATAYAYNLKGTTPAPWGLGWRMTREQVERYVCQPIDESVLIAYRKGTPLPLPTPVVTPVVTPETQGIMIPHDKVNYTCPGCSPLNPPPTRHTSKTNPYITNRMTSYGNKVVYMHVIGTEVRYFDACGNEYIDVNNSGDIMDELVKLFK